jgi:hypothetical protein
MRATRSGSQPAPAEFRFSRSEYQALNPVGRITYCIRLPGRPATCGVPQEDAPLRSAL